MEPQCLQFECIDDILFILQDDRLFTCYASYEADIVYDDIDIYDIVEVQLLDYTEFDDYRHCSVLNVRLCGTMRNYECMFVPCTPTEEKIFCECGMDFLQNARSK